MKSQARKIQVGGGRLQNNYNCLLSPKEIQASKVYVPECKNSGSVVQVQCSVQGVQLVHCSREKQRNNLSSYRLLPQSVKWGGFYFIVEQFYFSYFQPGSFL